ncbi:hypothetical protein Mapa_016189 [Marchantia paleacea]|nr:hypothetical protein Mapa_016189 [Marchantia paleacea]
MTFVRKAFQQNVRYLKLAIVANECAHGELEDTLWTTEREASDSGRLCKNELPWTAIPFADRGSNNHCDRGDPGSSECEFHIQQQYAKCVTIQNQLYTGFAR